jgi:hypothetical protein
MLEGGVGGKVVLVGDELRGLDGVTEALDLDRYRMLGRLVFVELHTLEFLGEDVDGALHGRQSGESLDDLPGTSVLTDEERRVPILSD